MELVDRLKASAKNHHFAANLYERGGNVQGAAQGRAIENLLWALIRNIEGCVEPVLPLSDEQLAWVHEQEYRRRDGTA